MATITSKNSGNWNSNGTWNGGVPAATDTVIIQSGDTVTLNTNTASLASLTISSGGGLSVASSRTLTTTGGTNNSGTLSVTTNGTTLSISGALTNTNTGSISVKTT